MCASGNFRANQVKYPIERQQGGIILNQTKSIYDVAAKSQKVFAGKQCNSIAILLLWVKFDLFQESLSLRSLKRTKEPKPLAKAKA